MPSAAAATGPTPFQNAASLFPRCRRRHADADSLSQKERTRVARKPRDDVVEQQTRLRLALGAAPPSLDGEAQTLLSEPSVLDRTCEARLRGSTSIRQSNKRACLWRRPEFLSIYRVGPARARRGDLLR